MLLSLRKSLLNTVKRESKIQMQQCKSLVWKTFSAIIYWISVIYRSQNKQFIEIKNDVWNSGNNLTDTLFRSVLFWPFVASEFKILLLQWSFHRLLHSTIIVLVDSRMQISFQYKFYCAFRETWSCECCLNCEFVRPSAKRKQSSVSFWSHSIAFLTSNCN